MSVKLRPGSAGAPVKIDYEFPSWCGRAPPGTHLDVMKDDKLIEKLLIDEKKYYIFGRNNEMCDFITNHASCSRAHAAILYHKILKKAFVVDLKSAHGTFLGYKRLEPHVPIQLPADIQLRLGASTRSYVFKDKPLEKDKSEQIELPEEEEELDNLTEYNTARNKKLVQMPVEEQPKTKSKKRKSVTWNNEEDVINPEDVDPSIGKFRNSCSVTIIPAKRARPGSTPSMNTVPKRTTIAQNFAPKRQEPKPSLYQNLPSSLPDITSAPDPDKIPELPASFFDKGVKPSATEDDSKKSKLYEKEAWPGRKPNEKSENFGI